MAKSNGYSITVTQHWGFWPDIIGMVQCENEKINQFTYLLKIKIH